MTEEQTNLLDMLENVWTQYTSDMEIPNDVLEEIMFNIDVELRERDEEDG